MKLYDYFRSSACYRVRIALNLKNIAYEKITIHLANNGGEQHQASYQEINPQKLVPSLEVDNQVIHQSLAIINYLDEAFPKPAFLPKEAIARAQVRALALLVACDVHPLNNLRVLNYLKNELATSEQQVTQWYHHWLKAGFDAFEAKLAHSHLEGPFCWGNTITLADICLIPQVYNAHRFNFPLENYPRIVSINTHCLSLAAFQNAAP